MLFLSKEEVEIYKDEVRQEVRKELFGTIFRETGARKASTHITFQDSDMVQGTFITDNGREGSFSFLKSIVPALVVNVYLHECDL